MTKDEIIKIAQKVTGVSFPLGIEGVSIGMNEKHLQDFANAIMEAERDECAYIADQGFRRAAEGDEIADLIRARGKE
jgi:hypothetical protein